MPTISRFSGISITMHWDEPGRHAPHFHARCGRHKASFDLGGNVIAGSLPRRQLRLVQGWAKTHANELHAHWRLATAEEPLQPISPLS